MIQNIKVDLIYYATPSDFEMEFNLNGCCRMRLLTDKAEDRKAFLNSLSRAVGRSKVIITCGSLFGSEGLISTVGSAIGKKIVAADNKVYGINSDEEISIISGSVPLVTADGIFGGCIIECGPQTIIMLTESKSIKKQLLKDLIHPYISELSMLPESPAPVVTTEETTEEAAEEAMEEVAEETVTEAVEEVAAEEPAEEENPQAIEDEKVLEEEKEDVFEETDETVLEEESSEAPEEEIIDYITEKFEDEETEEEASEEEIPIFNIGMENMHIEAETPKRDARSYYEYFVPGSEDDIFIPEDEEFDNLRPTGSKLNAPIIIIAVLLVLMLCVIAYFLFFIPVMSGENVSEYIAELFSVSPNSLI